MQSAEWAGTGEVTRAQAQLGVYAREMLSTRSRSFAFGMLVADTRMFL